MIYRSYYKESLGEYCAHELSELEKHIFEMLFEGFGVKQKLQSAYFELFRVGDGKYTMTVQKYIDGSWSVKFTINNKYKNETKRFSY